MHTYTYLVLTMRGVVCLTSRSGECLGGNVPTRVRVTYFQFMYKTLAQVFNTCAKGLSRNVVTFKTRGMFKILKKFVEIFEAVFINNGTGV